MSLLFLIVALYIFIQTPFGQNWISRQVTKRLSRDLQTKVSIRHVDFSLFNNMHLEGVLIEDRQGDTLLYAGDVKVRITDWFFLKKEAELKYIGLENAIIKFQRTDSVWRQQFIFDYFSSPSTGSSPKKKAGIVFNLKKAELKNVTFIKKDAWLGNDMTIRVAALNLEADKLSFSGNQYEINSLLINEPEVALYKYPRLKPRPAEKETDPVEEIVEALSWNRAKTIVKLGDLKIINGTFKTDRQSDRQPFAHPIAIGFDGQHILFTEINGEWSNASFIGDTILSKLKLSAKERSGFELKNLTADVKMTPQGMAFSNMDLVTNRSTLRNFFSMSYADMSEMDDFVHKVQMAAVFEDSYVDSDDIAFFAPGMRDWKKKITLKGKIRGPVSDLVGRDLLVQAGNSTVLNGDITLTGLPDIEQTFIDFKANDFRTTYGDAVTIVPAIRRVTNPDLAKIQYVNFQGSFTGFVRDFVTFGTIQTNLGTIRSDINMKLPRGQDPVYSGNIATDNFKLGYFLGDPKIGDVSLSGTVKGKGFSEKTRNTLIDGTIRYADYNDYRYQNIGVKGRLDKRLFEGFASIRDENADLELNGIIDFNSKTPRFNLIADVAKSDLRNLRFTRDSITFRGKLNLDFTSNSIDDFLGTARISDATLTSNGTQLPFDSLVVSADVVNGERVLTAASNEFSASITGDYSLEELPAAFTFLLNKYYPAYVKAPRRQPKNQNIKFDIRTYYVDPYLQLIDRHISGLNNSHLEGTLNLAESRLDMTADIQQFKYRQYIFNDVKLTASGTDDSLVVAGQTNNIRINDSLSIPLAVFKINAHNDSSRVSIITGANQTVEKADINALVLTYTDGVEIEVEPSNFTINGKLWTIDENGVLRFRRNNMATGQLVLSEGQQKIMFRTEPSPTGNWNDIKVALTKLNLGDFAPFFMPKNRLEGLVNGNLVVENPSGNMKIYSDEINTQYLKLDNDSLGEVKTSFVYDNSLKQLKVNGTTVNQENFLGFDANLFFGDPQKAKDNIIALKARNFQIKILERFLGNLFSDMQGYLTGDINVTGEFSQLGVTGKGRLKDAGLKVNFTQCFYKIQDTDIELTPSEINLDGIILKDPITGNPIYITGGIEHQSFKNMFYNLNISTQKPNTTGETNNLPVQLLKTGYRDNKQFYGDVKGTGSLTLAGPQSAMFMDINAIASARDSSYITLPASSSRESGMADFLVEKKYGREMTEVDINSNTTNIIYDVNVTATNMVTVKVVLDELTGDEIKGKGSGSLNIKSGTSEPLSLRGRFDIEEGNYLFTFQSFFKKPFELRKGEENYIEWNGDPYKADINLNAVYKAERISFAPLGQSFGLSSDISNARGDVFVVAKLTDQLFSPRIEFGLEFPPNSPATTDPQLALYLQQIQKNINEINRQVTYLIVFNSFAASELGAGQSENNFGFNTISGILLSVVSDQLNKILGNLFKDDKFNITLNTSFYNRSLIGSGSTLNLGSNVNFSIGRSFFNNRFIISTGVGLDAPLQQSSSVQQSIQLLPDVTMEWLVNPSGSLRASFFYRENTDYLSTAANGGSRTAKRYGVSFSYRKDFDRLGDLFKRKNKKPKTATPAPPPAEEKKDDTVKKGE